jgi:hypothetical protein
MTADPLKDARDALRAGRADEALRQAWEAVRPAVLAQNDAILTSAMGLAEEIAAASDDATREEARRLAGYCAACIVEPRDTVPSFFSTSRLFSRRRKDRRPCPDCAEEIAADARVCRYCGYRLQPPPG